MVIRTKVCSDTKEILMHRTTDVTQVLVAKYPIPRVYLGMGICVM